MQLGFVIDHSRCIGCHACTVACKAENDVPLGQFRTWVKYTEKGTFPEVKRSFAVLRCNQCSQAPCIEICPVGALHKRPDGIVDIRPELCIGCKACMQACPYDALYLNEERGIAEKCHFCAHRTERGLAPACAVVCPTEAIIPGDFHDAESRVGQLKAAGGLTARKPEAGTVPNVLYKEVDAAGIDPAQTSAAGGFLWAEQLPGLQRDADLFESLERRAEARTVYDVQHPTLWGGKVSAYLFTKSLSAGAFLAVTPLLVGSGMSARTVTWVAALALTFLLITTALLILDLKRPERCLYILLYANWNSWLARGTLILVAYGAVAAAWLLLGILRVEPPGPLSAGLALITAVTAGLTACYTAWLFRQAAGRVLWMRRWLALELVVDALVAGAAMLLLLSGPAGFDSASTAILRWMLVGGLGVRGVVVLSAGRLAPPRRAAEYARAHRLITRGPFSRRHWILGVAVGTVAPLLLLPLPAMPALWSAGAVAALLGLLVEQDINVRAGQALPIS